MPSPEYKVEADQWRSDLPLTVLRVRPIGSDGPVERYGSLTFEKRTANSESDLAGDMQNLIDAACSRAKSLNLHSAGCAAPPPASSFLVDPLRDYGWIGPYCREINMN